MAVEEKFIVAIDLGSSHVTALAGRKAPDGAIEVLAWVREPSEQFVRKGRVNNFNKMSQCVTGIKDKLEKRLQKRISRVYVGVGGMGLHSEPNTVSRHFGEKTVITQEMLASIDEANRNAAPADMQILESVPQEFRIGAQSVSDPVGMQAESIEGHYLNIVSRTSVGDDIRTSFRSAGVAIAGQPIAALLLADTILAANEKRSGCVFVDMGAETTTVAIYKNNVLRHMAVIPLGGANVNMDLRSLTIEDDEAEELKRKYGSALYPSTDKEHAPIHLRDGRQVKFEDFAGLVEARMEEIILNINNQILLSKLDKQQLIGGIIITGGAACMKDTDKAFERYTEFEKLRFVRTPRLQVRDVQRGQTPFNEDGTFSTVLAMVDKCELNCCGGELGTDTPDIFAGEGADVKPADDEPKTEEKKAADEPTQQSETEVEEETKPKKPGMARKFGRRFYDWATRLVSDSDNNEEQKQRDDGRSPQK